MEYSRSNPYYPSSSNRTEPNSLEVENPFYKQCPTVFLAECNGHKNCTIRHNSQK